MHLVRSFLIFVLFNFPIVTLVAQTIIPAEMDGQWGLKDSDGDWTLPPTYEKIGWSDGDQKFADGMIGYRKNGFWGLLNDKGKRITNPIYRSLTFPGGRLFVASSLGTFSRKILYGLIDSKGRTVASFRYMNIERGYAGQYIVSESLDGRIAQGVIIPGEPVVIPLSYQKVTQLNQGQYLLQSFSKLLGVADMEGEKILPVKYDQLALTEQNTFILGQLGLLGLANRDGTIIQPVNAKRLTANGLEAFPTWSVRDESNKTLDKIIADSLRLLNGGRLLLYRNEKRTIYQPNSEVSASLENLVIVDALEDAMIARGERGYEVLRPDGSQLLNGTYDSVYYDQKYFYVRYTTNQGEQWHLYTQSGTKLTKSPVNRLLPMSADRFRFKQDGFWGLLDFDGTVMVQQKYDTILPFVRKKAIVGQGGQWGVIDNQNQWVILPYENSLKLLENGLFVARKGYHIKFFNQHGEHIRSITTHFEPLGQYIKIYGETNKMGLMAPSGRMITSIAYDELEVIPNSDLFFARIDSTAGIIDEYEHPVLPFTTELDSVIGTSEGLIGVRLQGKYGFVNLRGQLIIANRYDDIQLFASGLAAYKLNGKWGFMDTKENLVIQPFYDEVLPFYGNVTAVRDGQFWGLIDQEGSVVDRLRYQQIKRTLQGSYEITGDEGAGLLAADGSQIFRPAYDVLKDIGDNRAIVRKNDKWGVVNYDGTYFIPTLYRAILYSRSQSRFLVQEN